MVPGFHYFLAGLWLVGLIAASVNFFSNQGKNLPSGLLLLILLMMGILGYYARSFALRAQDRAIRAEENLRHFALTGQLLDPQLRMGQIIALRFASDGELPGLAKRAVSEKLKNDQIKRAIQIWRPDYNRV